MGLVTYRGIVNPTQCDHMGHMNVAWYVAKFDEATWQLFTAIGLGRSRLDGEKIGMAGVEQHLEYKRELFAGDVISVTSTILEIKDKAIRFAHEMIRDDTGELAAKTVLVAVHLDAVTRKARAFPADVRERAQAMVAVPT
ncbi:MAG TPA: thioesterase family protein [Candidatus Polarisedimenticolia bacterium]|nr:thioesterase family protein [Candidatus Polarisedimenticolia bacterium]